MNDNKHRALARQDMVELQLRRRAAKLQAIANRNEAMKALKANIKRSELARLQGIMNIAPNNQNTVAAIEQLKNIWKSWLNKKCIQIQWTDALSQDLKIWRMQQTVNQI